MPINYLISNTGYQKAYDDAIENPETYTPSLRTDWGKENLLNMIVEEMTAAGIGDDITDRPEAHCDEPWVSDITWDSSYNLDFGGWYNTEIDCPGSWLDFYNDGVGSNVTLDNGTEMPTSRTIYFCIIPSSQI